ncbi:recombinase family protein [Colwellia sp. MB3u-55]|uniref:recombinase family protein n=1 Tax=Colwellia sp. MB3u-55 TaxID=2759810 RepID=UPI0015F741C2|nr:recombinase family protein [Colwellia sp. MB3u-55]MBA6252860.1 recombinase family protein [Colwellia sp. MB3u-55]
MATAYSYIRFSSDKQVKGDSLRRQEKLIADWVNNNPEIPLSSTSYKDLGISGYTGKHLDHGLGKLLAAIKSGFISAGDIILLESIDRAGRLPIEDMLTILLSIVKDGITIITLEDGVEYNKKSIANSAIFILAGKTQAAHAYSKQLSNRLLKARAETRNNVIAGKLKKISVHCPWWIKWDDVSNDWVALEDKVKIVQLIFDLYIKGDGINKITTYLNQHYPEGHSTAKSNSMGSSAKQKLNKGWYSSAVNRCLFDRRAIGEVTSKDEQLPNYYPKVISISTYQTAKEVNSGKVSIASRSNDKVKPPLHMFHDLVYCTCGELCTHQNKGSGVFMFTCKKRVRGLCSASSSLNTQLIDTHIRPFIHAIELDQLVKKTAYLSNESKVDDEIKLVPLDNVLSEKKQEYRRSLKAFTSGLVMEEDEDEELERISKLNSEIRDIEAQQKETVQEQFLEQDFDINDLLNTKISGFTCNLFLKVQSYQITLHANGIFTLQGSYTFNDESIELLRIKKKGKSLKGSTSTTIFETNPYSSGGLYNPCLASGEGRIFINVDNEGKQSFHGDYLVNEAGKLKTYRSAFTKEIISPRRIEGFTYIDGIGYSSSALLQKDKSK